MTIYCLTLCCRLSTLDSRAIDTKQTMQNILHSIMIALVITANTASSGALLGRTTGLMWSVGQPVVRLSPEK